MLRASQFCIWRPCHPRHHSSSDSRGGRFFFHKESGGTDLRTVTWWPLVDHDQTLHFCLGTSGDHEQHHPSHPRLLLGARPSQLTAAEAAPRRGPGLRGQQRPGGRFGRIGLPNGGFGMLLKVVTC